MSTPLAPVGPTAPPGKHNPYIIAGKYSTGKKKKLSLADTKNTYITSYHITIPEKGKSRGLRKITVTLKDEKDASAPDKYVNWLFSDREVNPLVFEHAFKPGTNFNEVITKLSNAGYKITIDPTEVPSARSGLISSDVSGALEEDVEEEENAIARGESTDVSLGLASKPRPRVNDPRYDGMTLAEKKRIFLYQNLNNLEQRQENYDFLRNRLTINAIRFPVEMQGYHRELTTKQIILDNAGRYLKRGKTIAPRYIQILQAQGRSTANA